MREFMRRTAFGVLTLMMMAAACLWQSSPVEAAAKISWSTSDVILEDGSCTVCGHFRNDGDVGATITKVKIIVNVTDARSGANVYSGVWTDSVSNCFLGAGNQKNWRFWHKDNFCPKFDKENMRYDVKFIWWKK